MNEVKLRSSRIRLRITLDDEERGVVSFNPNDVKFVEGYYNLMADAASRVKDYERRIDALEPNDFRSRFELEHDVCKFVRDGIDKLFGTGTSEQAFGDSEDIEMLTGFFQSIMPYIEKKREETAKKYLRSSSELE